MVFKCYSKFVNNASAEINNPSTRSINFGTMFLEPDLEGYVAPHMEPPFSASTKRRPWTASTTMRRAPSAPAPLLWNLWMMKGMMMRRMFGRNFTRSSLGSSADIRPLLQPVRNQYNSLLQHGGLGFQAGASPERQHGISGEIPGYSRTSRDILG